MKGPGPLLYRPAPRWQAVAAFGGAIAVHLAAVAIAAIHPKEEVLDLSQIPEATVEMSLETQPEAQPTPPPEEEPPPPPPPEAIPEQQPEFVEEKPTPPPKRPPTNAPVVPLAKPKAAGPMSMSSAKINAVSAPRPEYPYEARRSKTTGSGVCVMTVDSASGAVTSAEMAQSTGSPILDNAATSAFRRWRFKPGTVSKVRTPITFTMSGASY
jgi:protein TonB